MLYYFGDCKIDTNTQTLTVDAIDVPIEHRQFHLLQVLVESNNSIVTREQLMEKLWPQQIVSDSSLSRLISDTRKLIGDDGKSQHIIKTCRGGGFMLVLTVVNVKKKQQIQQLNIINWQIRIVVALILSLGLSVVLWQLTDLPNEDKRQAQRRDYQLILQIQQQLNISRTAIMVQFKRRDELGTMLKIVRNKQRIFWEQEFSNAYPNLTPSQRFVFDQIRGITDGSLLSANSQVAKILNEHPDLASKIASFTPLVNHLNFWLAKYHQVFSQRQDMCVLYVGVEDNLPFPRTVDDDVATWLLAHRTKD